ncbi:hypothetical protein EZS27_003232 [termite gut metagenome]|uniref:BIG2 domain-containing protein n=1 Tax=termite gut metagenome TaxID=433724 RepID=A0A5J4SUZ7_9ZZZZ
MKKTYYLLLLLVAGFAATFVAACSNDENDEEYIGEIIDNPVTGITLNVTGSEIALPDIGDTESVAISATPANAGDIERYHYLFTSSDPRVFTVNNEGLVTATGYGEAILNVVAQNNTAISAKCKVAVLGVRVASITIADASKNIELVRDNNFPTYNFSVTVTPDNASIKTLKYTTSDYKVATVKEIDGTITVTSVGKGAAIIRIEAKDGSGKYDECKVTVKEYEYRLLDRSKWAAIDSSPTTEVTVDEYTSGGPAYVIDNDGLNTAVGLLKAGAPGGPVSGQPLYFTIDMGEAKAFNYYSISGLWAGSLNSYVKINRFSLYGSNDGEIFTPLQENITVSTSVYDVSALLNNTHTYRYFKVAVTPSSTGITSGRTYVLVKDFKLGERVIVS